MHIANADLRVEDESRKDHLFPASRFVAIGVPDRVRSSLRRTNSPRLADPPAP